MMQQGWAAAHFDLILTVGQPIKSSASYKSMFADARSLWSSASSAIASLNENISTALEKIDADIDGPEGSSQEVFEKLTTDLEAYKAMLEDAQMQHFELSKQSRILLAEKEAELLFLRQQTPDQKVSEVEGNTLKYQKLLAEKKILEASLLEAQEQLKLSLHEKNEYMVMKKTHDEMMARFQNVKSDLSSMKVDVDSKDRQKNETIENLVLEYSKLAAEAELYQQQCDKRVAEVMKENEILVTKMHALEHSITELADRTVSPSPPVVHTSLAAVAGTPISSKHSSRADLAVGSPASSGTGSGAGHHSGNSDAELREARSKLVNLQFDVKEKEDEIHRLKAALAAATAADQQGAASMTSTTTATSTAAANHTNSVNSVGTEVALAEALMKLREEASKCEASERKLAKLESELSNQARDISRLTVEKREADEAGRKYLEQRKLLQQQYDSLTRTLRQQEKEKEKAEGSGSSQHAATSAAAEASAALASAELVQEQLQAQVEALQQQMGGLLSQHAQQLSASDDAHKVVLEEVRAQAAADLTSLREQLQAAQDAVSQGQESVIANMRSEHASQLAAATAAHEQTLNDLQANCTGKLIAMQDERDENARELAALKGEITSIKANFDSQIQASASGNDAEKQNLVSGYMQQITALQQERDDVSQRLATFVKEISALKANHESQIATAAAASNAEKQALLDSHAEQLAALQSERDEISHRLASKTDEMSTMKANFEAQIQASMSGSDAEKQNLMNSYTEQIAALQSDLSASQAALAGKEREAASLTAQLAEATAALEMHSQQGSTLQAELAAASDSLAAKTEEVAALSSQLAESQSLVASQGQGIATLQNELDLSQAALAASTAEVSALTAQLSDAQAALAAHQQQVQELTQQVDTLTQAAEAAVIAHNAALAEQAESAQQALETALESERHLHEQQLRDCEESIGVLRETHREEMISELEEQRIQLSAEHAAAQQNALSAAAADAAAVLATSLEQQQHSLLEQQRAQEDALRQAHAEEKQAALAANTADLTTQRENALAAQATAHAEALAQALAALTTEKDTERDGALEKLRQEKKQELEAALGAAKELADAAMVAAQATFELRAAEMDAQIAGLKADLAVVEEKHKTLLTQALSTLSARKDADCQAALVALRTELKAEVDAAFKERDEHLENYSKERKLRKKIHNRLLEIQGNIRVLCRVRPILDVERRSGEDVDVTEVPNEEELYVQRDQQCRTRYEYDRVFPQTSSQEEVFEAVQPLCVSVLDGYNVCIFAYGQTGSGKTFTMEGSPGNKGVSPRAIEELLRQIEQMKDTSSYVVTLSMLEIYNETILDLLPLHASREKEKLEIRQTGDGGNQVVGLTETTITSMAQVEELMRQGQKNRAVGSHDMNEHSSRSHSIITLVVRGKNLLDNTTTFGKLHLIDLAGSERVGKTDATGDRLKEAQNINKSLSALGEVINALGNKKATHVPYRNSKLTFLLQDSLGGNSKVLTFVNISPAVYNLGETVCSLNFATRCRSTELGQAKKQTGSSGSGGAGGSAGGAEDSAVKAIRRATSSTSSLNSSALLTPAAKR